MNTEEERIDKIKGLLVHPGWTDVVVPEFQRRIQQISAVLELAESERPEGKKGLNDDVLRGQLKEDRWLLTVFNRAIQVYEHNRKAEELQRSGSADGVQGEPLVRS